MRSHVALIYCQFGQYIYTQCMLMLFAGCSIAQCSKRNWRMRLGQFLASISRQGRSWYVSLMGDTLRASLPNGYITHQSHCTTLSESVWLSPCMHSDAVWAPWRGWGIAYMIYCVHIATIRKEIRSCACDVMSSNKVYLFFECNVCGREWRCWVKKTNPTTSCWQCGNVDVNPYEKIFHCEGCGNEWSFWTDPYDEDSIVSVCSICGVEVLCDEEEELEFESRQFLCSCGERGRTWWDTVLVDWLRSKCKKCGQWQHALDDMEKFGIGKFSCDCGNVFYGRIRARDTSRCFRCRRAVSPEIKQDYQHKLQGQPTSSNCHQCSWCKGRSRCKIFKKMSAYDQWTHADSVIKCSITICNTMHCVSHVVI